MLAPATAAAPPRVNLDPALSLKEAAPYLGISVKSVRRLIAAKRLEAVRVGSLKLAVRRSELERFLSVRAA